MTDVLLVVLGVAGGVVLYQLLKALVQASATPSATLATRGLVRLHQECRHQTITVWVKPSVAKQIDVAEIFACPNCKKESDDAVQPEVH